MLKLEPWPWFRKLFAGGANTDTEKELVKENEYENARNMRLGSVVGALGSLEKIGGEQVRHLPESSEIPFAQDYVCIGSREVSGAEVSFWASSNPERPKLVKIDGITMVRSFLLPYTYDHPLQFVVLSREQGGFLFPMDGESDALFFDIEAIRAAYAAGEQTYFDNLNIQAITVTLAGPEEWPEHVGNVVIGDGAAPGIYVPILRFYDAAGNRSNWGQEGHPISIPATQAPIYLDPDGMYPGGQTIGGVANVDEAIPTPNGFALAWQIPDNSLNFAGYELGIRRYNDGQGLTGPGITEVVARIPLEPGQTGWVFSPQEPYIYPRDNNFFELIPPDEAQQEHVNFYAPKTGEYLNNRLVYVNIKLRDRIVDLDWKEVDGSRTFPFTDRLFTRYNAQEYNDGHADPVNNTYGKSAMHNDRVSLGVMLFDSSASRSPVVPVQENVLLPGRATRKTADALKYSYGPNWRTNEECQSNDPVSPTFDAIVQGTRRKSYDQFVNVIDGANYNPFSPKSPSDPNYVRYRAAPIERWQLSEVSSAFNTGNCFAPEIHGLYMGAYGPTNLRQEAPWARVMTPMRNATASGRVIASGMATWSVGQYDQLSGASAYKNTNELVAYFPDFDSAFVPLSIQEDVRNNPRNYKLKFTPFGAHPEVYAYRLDFTGLTPLTRSLDVITYMDIQFDPGTSSPRSVNAGEPGGAMGVQPTFSAPASQTNNIGYQAWRRFTADIPPPLSDVNSPDYLVFMDPLNTAQGAKEIGFDLFQRQEEGRGNTWRIRLTDKVYRSSGSLSGQYFSDTQTRRAHEPMWIIELIRSDAEVPTENIPKWALGGRHIAIERMIGVFVPDQNGQMDIELFHARLFDAKGRTPNDQRYAYVQTLGVPERRWLCATDNAVVNANLATIIADINANGFWVDPDGNEVYGLYSVITNIDTRPHPVHFLRMGDFTDIPAPPAGSRIVVKYDDREPILWTSFDCTIDPSIWAVWDRWFNASNGLANGTGNTQVFSTFPILYNGAVRNPNYVLPRDGNAGGATVETQAYTNTVSYRQWVVMGHVLNRTPQRFNTGGGDALKYAFPRQHYINRPTLTIGYDSAAQNGFNPVFDDDFQGEAQFFGFGGFRFKSTYNLDYARQAAVTGLGIPVNGQDPRTDLPTAHIASDIFDVLAQDRPGFRTFRKDNMKVISEENGEVKFIASLDQSSSQRLWGWTQSGVYYLLYNKEELTDADGNVIGTQSIGNFWAPYESWPYRGDHGMPDELWQCAVKANAATGNGGSLDTVFWVDRVSAYQLFGGAIKDIAIGEFQKELQPVLQGTPGDFTLGYNSVYNRKNKEWWMGIVLPDGSRTIFVYSPANGKWVGHFTYEYDQLLNIDTQVIGYRDLQANNLGVGLTMEDGTPVQAWAETAFAPYPGMQSELVAWRVNPDKPDELRIYDKNHVLMLIANEAEQEAFDPGTGFLWVMEIDGYQQMMNSVSEAYAAATNADREPPQSTGFYMRVYFTRAENQRLTFASLQAKQLP